MSDCLDEFSIWIESQSLTDPTGHKLVYQDAFPLGILLEFHDGVSLVLSYRSQFNSILRTSRFTELLDRMRSREAYVTPRDD